MDNPRTWTLHADTDGPLAVSIKVVSLADYEALKADRDRLLGVIESISLLGKYCCDNEGLGSECPAVFEADEARANRSPKGDGV